MITESSNRHINKQNDKSEDLGSAKSGTNFHYLLRAISRFIIGITFILSGFLKAIDPVGVALKIDEYLKAFHMGFLDFTARPAGVLLSAAEFIIGVCILKGIKMRFFSRVALWFIMLFTLLTFYSALFNPVQDCGCFGEAIHLTNWETFFKNVVLLTCACIVYLQRGQFKPIATKMWENIYLICYSVFILSVSIYALIYLPQVDFGGYKAGTDLVAAIDNQPEMEYETTFIYTKNGENKEFTLNNLPDSTWTFVEANTQLISAQTGNTDAANFILKNSYGDYITGQVLSSATPTFFVSVYNPNRLESRQIEKITALRDSVTTYGGDFYIVSGISGEEAEEIFGVNPDSQAARFTQDEILYTDYKTALLLNRSNAGVVYVNDGIIVCKWSRYSYPTDKMAKIWNEDYEVLTANLVIKEQLFIEISIALVLFMILIVRFISKRLYKEPESQTEIV